MMRVRLVFVSFALLATMCLAGCDHYICGGGATFGNASCSATNGGGNTNSGGGGNYLLIADAGGIQGEVLDGAAGTIELTPGFGSVPVNTNVPGTWMVVAQATYMYVGYTSIGQIYGWKINGDGTLTTITGSPFTAGFLANNSSGGLQGMVTNPAGTLLFVTDVNNKQINVYQIGSGGGLTLASGSPLALPSGFEPYNLAVDGLGKYLYVSNNNGGEVTNEVAAYSIGSTGALAPVSGTPFSSAIIQMQGESSGKYMIGITSPLVNADNHLYVMNIGATGALTQTLFPTVNVPGALTVQPSSGGDLVYSFPLPGTGGDGVIEGYTLSLSGGTLTAISGSPFTVTGLNAQFDQTGQYLFVLQSTNGIASAIQAYNVGTSPTLTTPLASVGWAAGGWSPATVQ